MSQSRTISEEIYYPESDGVPMVESDVQYRYIVTIKENLLKQYTNRSQEVYVGSDLFWYPVEGDPKICVAPDVMLVFGRPQADRRRYQQWLEGNIGPQVIFEIWSASNRNTEKDGKLKFYSQYGIQEYYAYDPDEGVLEGWQRQSSELKAISQMQGWVSPLLGVRFELEGATLVLFGPDDQRFVSPQAWVKQLEQEREQVMYERNAKERAWAKLREFGIDPQSLL